MPMYWIILLFFVSFVMLSMVIFIFFLIPFKGKGKIVEFEIPSTLGGWVKLK